MKRSTIYYLRSHSGFTLMELLIVIAIMGILLSIAVTSYLSTQKKTRDTRRVDDMKAVQAAWEMYFADNGGTYPTDCTYSVSATPTPGVMSAYYMPGGFPVDPKSGAAYTATSGWAKCTSSAYCFCAGMEYTTSGNATKNCDGQSLAEGTSIYCVNQLQ